MVQVELELAQEEQALALVEQELALVVQALVQEERHFFLRLVNQVEWAQEEKLERLGKPGKFQVSVYLDSIKVD